MFLIEVSRYHVETFGISLPNEWNHRLKYNILLLL